MMDIIDFLLFLHKRMLIHRMLRFMILGKYSTNQIFQSVKMLQLKSQSYRKMMMRDNLLAK